MGIAMQAANRLQKALKKGAAPSFGGWQMLPGANHSRAIARSGLDWICVDCEHGNIDDGAMHEAVQAHTSCGISPIVRIPGNEGWMVKRALDTGAHGIVVPLLETPDDAQRLVRAAKFPPAGKRGFGSPLAHHRVGAVGGVSGVEYLQQANDALLTVIQIETKEALKNVKEIASVPGVDVLFIGPFDLSINIESPIVSSTWPGPLIEAITRIHSVAKEAGKKTGIYCTSGDQAREFADKGFDMISVATDVPVVTTGFGEALAKAKGGWSHAAYSAAKGAVGEAAKLASR